MTVTIDSQFNHRKSELGRKELNNKLGGLEKVADFGQVCTVNKTTLYPWIF